MPETDIGKTITSDLTNEQADYSVDAGYLDSPQDQKENFYTITKWNTWLGYYQSIPELQKAVDTKATWTIGKGFVANETTQLLLMTIKGFGKDTFNTILENMIRTYHIAGDAFAEIIRDKNGTLINIKPLDPAVIRIVADKKGLITRYDQLNKVKGKLPKAFQPEDIFHLTKNRLADEIHGVSIIPALEPTILALNEAKTDWRKVLHRNVAPIIIWHLDTDDETKIAHYEAKAAEARANVENIFVPKGDVVPEVLSVAPNATMNPLPWIQFLVNQFWEAVGVPQIIVGGTGAITEAAVKIAYLAFEQTIEEEQLFIEEQVLTQLNLEINLEFPATLQNEALSDKPKEEGAKANAPEIEQEQPNQPNDTTAEMEGRK